jgi:membrane protein implicated in regulation of membrane protease activity
MEPLYWILWLVLGVLLIVAEIFTLGFFLIFFGVGAIAASLAAMLGVGIVGQFLIFLFVSGGLTALSRTIFSQYLHPSSSELKMGTDSLPGQIGTVTVESKGALNEAAVKVFGSEWTAFPEDSDDQLVAGEKVEVIRIKGSSIYVRKVTKELPGWKQD